MAFNIFISYAHEDQAFRQELDKHLHNLQRQQIISSWHDGDISPGTERQLQIIAHLKTADIILLLVSADFMASDFCYSTVLQQAIARHDAHEAHVIPILLRPCDWEGAPFAKLTLLPTDAKAVTRWPSHDDAFEDIVQGIKRALSVAPTNTHPNVLDSAATSGTPGTASTQAPQQSPLKPTQPKPLEPKIPSMGNYFLSGQDREELLTLLDTILGEIPTAYGIKALLRGILPDALINRINYKDASRNIAENIVGILTPRGALNHHYHTLGAFLNNLLENQSVSVSYDAAVTIVSLLFRYTLVTDRERIERLSGRFQVAMEGE